MREKRRDIRDFLWVLVVHALEPPIGHLVSLRLHLSLGLSGACLADRNSVVIVFDRVDLLVHRSLVEAFNLGAGGLPPDQKEQLLDMADHITDTEVCSAKAERSTRDRLVAAFLSTQIGDRFFGRVVAINDAGAYVALKGMGADGFLLKREMAELGRACRIGEPLEVILKEADGLSGNIMVSLAKGRKPAAPYRRRA